jgi:phosphate transport system substrate-binding protein
MNLFKRYVAAVFATFLFCLNAGSVAAQDVVLTSLDGTVTLSGNLLTYDNEFYQIETEFGVVTLDAQGVQCDGPGCPDLSSYVAEVVMSGAPTIASYLIPSLLADYARVYGLQMVTVSETADLLQFELRDQTNSHPEMRVAVHLTSSDAGLVDLMSQAANVALSFSDLGNAGLRETVLALDAFVPIISTDNALSSISMVDLVAVLSGQLTSWADLGGPDVPINLHVRDAGAGEQQALEARLLGPSGIALATGAQRHASNRALTNAVARDPFAFAVALQSTSGRARAISLTGSCGITLSATRLAIKAEDYPLAQPLFLITTRTRLPLRLRQFLDYLNAPSTRDTVRQTGFTDPFPEVVPLTEQGQLLSNAIAVATDLASLQQLTDMLRNGARLSIAFRFEPGTAQLDAHSRANVATLAHTLEAGLYDGQSVMFLGFTDSDGPAAINRRLSRQRAEVVRNAVLDAAPLLDSDAIQTLIAGFGPAMPIACDDTPWGQEVNRRVEVWLRPLITEAPAREN